MPPLSLKRAFDLLLEAPIVARIVKRPHAHGPFSGYFTIRLGVQPARCT
jgi:hypothetical protein